MVAVVTPTVNAEMWLLATHFAFDSTRSRPSVQPNSRRPVKRNKTIGLETPEGVETDGC